MLLSPAPLSLSLSISLSLFLSLYPSHAHSSSLHPRGFSLEVQTPRDVSLGCCLVELPPTVRTGHQVGIGGGRWGLELSHVFPLLLVLRRFLGVAQRLDELAVVCPPVALLFLRRNTPEMSNLASKLGQIGPQK